MFYIKERFNLASRKSSEDFAKEIHAISPDITLLGTYTNMRTKIPVSCNICGHKWEAFPQPLLNGHGCPICGHKKSAATMKAKATDRAIEVAEELKQKFPTIHPLQSIRTASEDIDFECDICHNIWRTAPNRLLKQRGCPRCNSLATSLPEQFLYEMFSAIFPDEQIRNRDRLAIKKELDIYIPSKGIAVEYGAWYWHKNKIDTDILKEKLCKEQNVNLLTIYEHVDETPTMLPANTLIIDGEITNLEKCKTLAKLVLQHFMPEYNCSTLNWENLYENALEHCSPEAVAANFLEQMAKLHPDIEILGTYTRFHEPIEVRCKTCGHIWKPRPRYLISEKSGCPKCAIAKRAEEQTKSTEDFAKELKALNPNLQLISEYTHSRSNVKIRCNNCGCTWTARADYVLADYKCPSCETAAKRKSVLKPSAQGHIKKQENLSTKLAKLDKNIEIIGKVTSDTEPVTCRCKKCKTVFERTPKDLLRHPHCPKCNKHYRYTPETFRARMEEINPDIEIIGDFKKQAEKLECRCKICDHHWMVTPNKLLQGRGCPKCAAKVRSAAGVAARKKKEQKEAESKDSA